MQPLLVLTKVASFKETRDFILLSYDMDFINVEDSVLHLPQLRFASQLLLEPPLIPTTKQNNTVKKFDFSTGRVFVERDKPENTK